jgi:hypothetical protein
MPASIYPPKIEDQLKMDLVDLGNRGFEVVSIFPHPQKAGHLLLVLKQANGDPDRP